MLNPLILIAVFIISTILGYIIIRKVPSLLHTPLMSGMNALSGVSIVGAVGAVATLSIDRSFVTLLILGAISIILAMINVAGGFGVTHRMLRMFNKKKGVIKS